MCIVRLFWAGVQIESEGATLVIDLLEHTAPIRSLMGDPRLPMSCLTRILFAAVLCLIPACAAAQNDTGPAPHVAAIHRLIDQYTKAVDTVDLKLLSQIWSHSTEVSFIYPLGEEHGFDAIEQHVFQNVMGGMFSVRDLETHGVAIHVDGNAAWSEFHWVFHATMRKDGSAVTTHGVETQIYRKESGNWRLVHVHYSEDRQAVP